jgi:hypothetical protein
MPEPYVNAHPGDLITAQLFNGLQSTIKQDIADQIKKAIDALKTVDKSGDSAKLGGKTPEQLESEILEKALQILPSRTGYRMVFKRLKQDVEKYIKHKLSAFPLVDLYQLDYFDVVCGAARDADQSDGKVNFFLFQSGEKKLKSVTPVTAPAKPPSFEIQKTDSTPSFRIPFETMLKLFGVEYNADQNLGDLVDDFWEKVFDPNGLNDTFEQDQYCNSPWFEQCCGEKRTVGQLKREGDWPNLYFQMRPRKTVNLPETGPGTSLVVVGAPPHIQVVHYDFDTIGIKLLKTPAQLPDSMPELKVMLLLKV